MCGKSIMIVIMHLGFSVSPIWALWPCLEVLAPQAGDTFWVGDTLEVRWRADTNHAKTLIVELTMDAGKEFVALNPNVAIEGINTGDPQYYTGDTGTWQWVIEETVTNDMGKTLTTASSDCLIRLIDPYAVNSLGEPCGGTVEGFFTIYSSSVNEPPDTTDTSGSSDTPQVTGIAVTNRWSSGWHNYGGFGDIWRYDIENGRIVQSRCLFRGRAHWPTLSPDGSTIAFFLKEKADSVRGNWIAVMDSDGSNFRRLSKIEGDTTNAQGNMSWPDGKYVYYNKGAGNSGVCSPAGSREVWRIDVDSPSDNGRFADFGGSVRCWNINLDASRTAVQYNRCSFNTVRTLSFPSMTEWPDTRAGSCNTSISASGNYVAGLSNSGHTVLNVAEWNGPKIAGVSNAHMAKWINDSVGHGMDRNRFSVNSDKWVSVRVGWPSDFGRSGGRFGKNGSNALIVNWMNGGTIRLTDNPRPKSETDTVWSSEPASFLVTGQSAVKEKAARYSNIPDGVVRGTYRSGDVTCFTLRGRRTPFVTLRKERQDPFAVRIRIVKVQRTGKLFLTLNGDSAP